MKNKAPWIIRYVGGMLNGHMDGFYGTKEEAEAKAKERADAENTGSGYVIS